MTLWVQGAEAPGARLERRIMLTGSEGATGHLRARRQQFGLDFNHKLEITPEVMYN